MILAFIYGFIALGFLIPTILEGNKAKLGWGVNRMAGIVACLGWPATVAAMVVSATGESATA